MGVQGFTECKRVIAAIAWGRLYGGRLYVNYHEVYAELFLMLLILKNIQF